jgi:(p)ppGpp synthase/HD superfamily hydrolase
MEISICVLEAINLAITAHHGQVDKAGVPYIAHPLRVMNQMDSDTERIVAVLHDAVEDSSLTLGDLGRLGYSAEIIEAIDCLTRREGETYRQYIERLKQNPVAHKVKIADLQDNMAEGRIQNLQGGGLEKRYQDALKILINEETNGTS